MRTQLQTTNLGELLSEAEPEANAIANSNELPQDLIGYPITLKKFILFNVLTLGLFEFVWAFKHFRALKGAGKAKNSSGCCFRIISANLILRHDERVRGGLN